MHSNHPLHFNLVAAAHASMIEHGFQPDFPAGTDTELAAIKAQPAVPAADGITDLRNLLWSSIDNDTSKDLDQIEWAEQLPDGRIRVLVGVADVDARVHKGTVIDKHAQFETTSVYTGVTIFPMLPTELSEGITSLNENEDRAAIVTEFAVDADGNRLRWQSLPRAGAQPRATRLPQRGRVARGQSRTPPAKVAASADLAAQLKLQDAAAQRMEGSRFQHGALDLETIETRPVLITDQVIGIAPIQKNRATSLIEEFMVAANGVIARTFEDARPRLHPPHRAHAQALGPHRRASQGKGLHAPRRARLEGAQRFSAGGKAKGSRSLSRCLADGHQAHGPRRVRAGQAQRALARPLRPRGSGLHALHRAQPPLSRHGHAAPAQGMAHATRPRPTRKTSSMPSRNDAR